MLPQLVLILLMGISYSNANINAIDHDVQTTNRTISSTANTAPAATEIAVFAKFRSPVASFVVPYPDNGTWMLCGYFAFFLQMLCERLHLRPIIETEPDVSTVMQLNNGFQRFRQIQMRFAWLYDTQNYIHKFNQR